MRLQRLLLQLSGHSHLSVHPRPTLRFFSGRWTTDPLCRSPFLGGREEPLPRVEAHRGGPRVLRYHGGGLGVNLQWRVFGLSSPSESCLLCTDENFWCPRYATRGVTCPYLSSTILSTRNRPPPRPLEQRRPQWRYVWRLRDTSESRSRGQY